MTTKPIDLIVANTMHDAVAAIATLPCLEHLLEGIAKVDRSKLTSEVARVLLGQIARHASMADVFKALAAVGAPASADMINEGILAVKDAQKA